jgi:hypothetical protein
MAAVFPNESPNTLSRHEEEELDQIHKKEKEIVEKMEQLVEEWANIQVTHPGILKPLDFLNPDYMKAKIKAGYCENISSFLKSTYKQGTDDSDSGSQEIDPKAAVDGYLALLTNAGIIGTLVFAVLFTFIISDFELAEVSIRYFGLETAKIFKYIFIAGVNLAVFASLFMITTAVTLYKHLGFWMPDLQSQLEWIHHISVTPIVLACGFVVNCCTLSIPFGAAAGISPVAGLFSLACVALFFIGYRFLTYIEEKSELVLQSAARRLLKRKKQNNSLK